MRRKRRWTLRRRIKGKNEIRSEISLVINGARTDWQVDINE